jgi:hypothetical protein
VEQSSQPLGWINFWKPKDDWYYLAPDARRAYFDQYVEVVKRAEGAGARRLGSYKCRGQSLWSRFEVWEFPDLRVLVEMNQALEEIGHYQYFAEDNTVGRRYDREPDPNTWVL